MKRESKGRTKNRRTVVKRLSTLLGAVAVFVTTYMLILPAITMETQTYCGETEHVHTSACYSPVLICGNTDTPGVSLLSGPDIYREQICGLEAHTHGEDCLDEDGQIICGMEEHEHTSDCYRQIELEPEPTAHVHTADCYEYVLTCQETEHHHTLQCFSNPEADTDATAWEAAADRAVQTLSETDRADVRQRVQAVAASQAGYTESGANYLADAEGKTRYGYTFYGAAYGAPYAEWNALYADWVLQKAAVSGFPLGAEAGAWYQTLLDSDSISGTAYLKNSDPQVGDLVFVRPESETGEEPVSRVGIITSLTANGLYAYEGDCEDKVAVAYYDQADPCILGYGVLPAGEIPVETVPAEEAAPAEEEPAAPVEPDTEILGEPPVEAPELVEALPLPEAPGSPEIAETAEPPVETPVETVPDGPVPQVFFSDAPAETVDFDIPEPPAAKPAPEHAVTADPDLIAAMQDMEKAAEKPSPIQTVVDFFGGLFRGGYDRKITAELDGVTITAEYDKDVLPPEAAMVVTPVSAEPYADMVTEATGKENRELLGYDISFISGNEVLEPEGEVKITFRADFIEENREPELVHIQADGNARVVEGTVAEGQISGVTDSFSVYVLSYTVDFHWDVDGKTYTACLPGGGYTSLESLVEALGLAESSVPEQSPEDRLMEEDLRVSPETKKFVSFVEKAEFSDPSLIWVGKVGADTTVGGLRTAQNLSCQYSEELTQSQIDALNARPIEKGDWAILSLQPFLTEETLTLTMRGGEQCAIRVTDGQMKKTVLTASGDSYEITVTCGPDAGIPEDAELSVREILPEAGNYQDLLKKAEAAVESGTQEMYIHRAAFFDIRILDGEKEIEPREAVLVRIVKKGETTAPMAELPGGEQITPTEMVLHYDREDPTVLDVTECSDTEEGVELTFKTDSFSDYGAIDAGYMCVIQPGDTVTLTSTKPGGTWSVANASGSNVSVTPKTGGATASAGNGYGIATVTHTYEEEGEQKTEIFKVRVANRPGTTPPTITTVTNQEANIVRMRLLDFDLLQTLDNEANSGGVNNGGQYVFNQSINVGHSLKFLGWGASAATDPINSYAGVNGQNAFRAVENIVGPSLVGGYPVLPSHSNESLSYLFNGSSDGNNKQVYDNAEGLFRLTEYEGDEYYEYNSNTNYAYYDQSTGSFSVYDRTYYQQSSGRKAVGFFPFTDPIYAYYSGYNQGRNWTNETTDGANSFIRNFNDKPDGRNPYLPDRYYLNPCNGAGGQKNNGGSAGYWNHHLGINMAVDFNVRKDGTNADGKESIFRFNGDDDMWVFVDGKLALDIGGLHQPINGSINFTTGECLVQTDQNGTMVEKTNIYTLFDKEDFIDLDKPHRLEVFYLERGGCDSNCKISFNMKKQPPKYGTIHFTKQAPNQTPVPGAKFQLFYDAACTEPLRRTLTTEEAIRAGFDVGQYDYAREDVYAFSDDNGWVRFPKVLTGTYYMKEVSVPEGYWASDEVYQVVVGEDPRVEAGAELRNEDPDPYTTINGAESLASGFNVENQRIIVNVCKTDSSGGALTGAEFRVTYTPRSGSGHTAATLSNLAVNNSGILTLDGRMFLGSGQQVDGEGDSYGLPDGTFTVQETKAPQGYEQTNLPAFSFTVQNGTLTRAGTPEGVSYNLSAGLASFRVVNKLPEGSLGLRKIWLDYDGNPMNRTGDLNLTLVQSVKNEHRVTVNYYCKGNGYGSGNNWDRTFIATRTGTGSGDVTFSCTWNSTTTDNNGMNGTTITDTAGNSYNSIRTSGNGGDRGRTRQVTIQNNQEDLEITVLIGNMNWTGTDDSLISQISFSGGTGGNPYTEVSRRTVTLSSGEDWSKVFTLQGDGLVADTTGDTIPATYDHRDSYYSILEENVPAGFDATVSTEQIHDQGTLTVTNRSNVQEHPIDVNLRKQDQEGRALSGAVFQLQVKNAGDAYQAIGDLTEADDIARYGAIATEAGPLETVTLGGGDGVPGTEYKSTFTTGEGNTKLTGLPTGEYKLVELAAPAGYVILQREIDFTVENGEISGTDVPGRVTFAGDTALITVTNEPGAVLPNTGGMGTGCLTVLGILLLTGTAVLLLLRKKPRGLRQSA